MWKQQHVVGHHAYTNVVGEDPDIRVKPDGSDVRRVVIQQPRGAHHAVQHLYLGLLYALLAFKSILVDDFSAVASGSIGSVKVRPDTATQLLKSNS
jgi:acyl-lipid (8-3)-desaturase